MLMLWTIVEILLSTTAISLYHIYFILICSEFTFIILCKFTFLLIPTLWIFFNYKICLNMESGFSIYSWGSYMMSSAVIRAQHSPFGIPGPRIISHLCSRPLALSFGNLGPLCGLQFSSRPHVPHTTTDSPLPSISLHLPSFQLHYFNYTLFHSYTLLLKELTISSFFFFLLFLSPSNGKVYTDGFIFTTPPVSIYTIYKISCHPLFLQQKHILSKVCIFAFLHKLGAFYCVLHSGLKSLLLFWFYIPF